MQLVDFESVLRFLNDYGISDLTNQSQYNEAEKLSEDILCLLPMLNDSVVDSIELFETIYTNKGEKSAYKQAVTALLNKVKGLYALQVNAQSKPIKTSNNHYVLTKGISLPSSQNEATIILVPNETIINVETHELHLVSLDRVLPLLKAVQLQQKVKAMTITSKEDTKPTQGRRN